MEIRIMCALLYVLFCIILIIGTFRTQNLLLGVIVLVIICQVASRIIN